MGEEELEGAWLEAPGRARIPIQRNCSIGRSQKSSVVLDSPKISRRHALIHVQNIGEFWLIDLGSINGTFLNKRRVHQPVQLSDQDTITIGDQVFTFRQPQPISAEYQMTLAERTIREIADEPCWLLLADIENFTPLSRSLVSDRLATLIGGWVSSCRDIIEAHQGSIDKYLGDGFLAYWRGDENATEDVAAAIHKLKELQAKEEPRFRLALHFGRVAIGGASSNEESLMGSEVNFVFRMEKLAGSLGVSLLTSAAAKSKLNTFSKCEPAGSYELKGFEGPYEFFSC